MREYLVVFLVAASVTFLLTVVAREVAVRIRAVVDVRSRDMHAAPMPYLGGVAMLGGLAAAYVVARQLPFLSRAEGYVFEQAEAVLAAGALICLVGVLDDRFELDAVTKLGGQVLAAGVLVLLGVQFYYVPLSSPDTVFALDPAQGAVLTVLVVVATVNAVNFVDGLDGLAAGVVGIGAGAFFIFCYQLANLNGVTLATTGALLSAALAGACAGFLPHNAHPARLFMGDSGSMLLGLMLSASALTLTGQFSGGELSQGGGGAEASLLPVLLPVVLPVSILVVPLTDMALAILRRMRQGRDPFAPDKRHLHHRLLGIGHSHRRAVVIMWLWAAMVGFGVVLISLYSGWWVVGLVLGLVVVTVAATFLLPLVHTHGADPPAVAGETRVPEQPEGPDGHPGWSIPGSDG